MLNATAAHNILKYFIIFVEFKAGHFMGIADICVTQALFSLKTTTDRQTKIELSATILQGTFTFTTHGQIQQMTNS